MEGETYDIVHLAPNEWGHEAMQSIAQWHFEDNPACEFVLVYEHGGWWLGYRRDGSLWDTANDDARVRGPMPKRFSGVSVRR